ncbi:PRC-barrel domain-containing protein [Salipiger marinus]|uniref:PRC-barrel domain-containing protein n=1 Tax=Salipiger marinus TaxID=555512 RepID=UPI0040595914
MRNITLPALSLILMAGAASAQTMETSSLHSIDDADVMGPDGNRIGEVEQILVDDSGTPVAAVVEAGGFLDIGDEDIVVPLEELTFKDGDFTTSMTEDELKNLPKWDD